MRLFEIAKPAQQLELGGVDPTLDCSKTIRPRTEIEILHKMVCDAAKAEQNRLGYPDLHVDIALALRGMRDFQSYKGWYMRHLQIVDQLFGPHKQIFYKFLAAASANTSPYWNAMYAIDAFLYWIQGGQDFHTFQRAGAKKGMGRLMPAHADYFTKIVSNPDYIPTGGKVSEFYHAIQGDLSRVPVDRWMLRIFFGDIAATPQRIAIVTRITTEWAKHLGWHPAEVQAALWCWFIHFTSRGRKEIQDYVKPLMQRAPEITRVMQQVNSGGFVQAA